MAAWTLTWTWAGITQTSPVAVSWSESASIGSTSAPVRAASLTLHPLGVDVLEVASSPAARVPGLGTLYVDGVEVLSGVWREVSYREGQISLTIGSAIDTPDVMWPGPSVVIRQTFAEGAHAFGQGKNWVERAFRVIYRIPTDMWGPVVFGAPGTSDVPGSPAYLLDPAAQDYGDGLGVSWRLVIHRGSTPEATEVQAWFPAGQATDRLVLDTRGDGVATAGYYLVRMALDDEGYPYAYIGVPVPTVTLSGGLPVVSGPLPSPDRPAAISWVSGGCLPGGAGSVLGFVLALTSQPVALDLWADAASYLDRYDLAGYVDQRVRPMDLARSILAYLPVTAVQGPRGLEPRLHPWARAWARRPLRAGHGLTRASDISEGEAPPTSVEIRYAVGPVSPDGAFSQVLDSTPYAIAGSSWGASDVEIRADWVWSGATATRIASDVLRLQTGGRRVSYLCDPALYGPGAAGEIRLCDVVALTDDDAYLDTVTAYVDAVEATAEAVRIQLVIRDDLLGAP